MSRSHSSVMAPTARRPEPARRVPVRETSGYVEHIGVSPGEMVRFHINAPAAYRLDVVRLGRKALCDPDADAAADRAEVAVMASFEHDSAAPQTIEPGSYIHVAGEALPAGPMTAGLWLRLWRLPVLDVVQWAWSGLITDLDYPEAARFALLVDHRGRIGVYVGDGAAFDHARLHVTAALLEHRLGTWLHIATTIDAEGLAVYLDGEPVLRHELVQGGLSAPTGTSRLRIGASAERGRADDFVDADISAPFVAARGLAPQQIASLVADRGRTPLQQLEFGPLHGAWELDEERGAEVADSSGNGRHGHLVQGGTWQIGGPAFDPSRGDTGYEPATDPDRGHGLRLSSDDLLDCEWSVTDEWRVPDDAESGLYAGLIRLAGQHVEAAEAITFAVVRRRPRRRDSVALLLSTNTWYAYGRRPRDIEPAFGLSSSFYSRHVGGRPFFWVPTHAPIPRATPFGFESDRAAFVGHSHLVRPERFAEAWLEREGYAYEVITDHDLHADPRLLKHYRALFLAGHSEYWSDEARDGVETFLDGGGAVLSLSGDSIHWRLTFDSTMSILECRKEVGEPDPRWLGPGQWGERWHSQDGRAGGSYRLLGRNAHETVGLDPQGMIDDGTPTGFRPLLVTMPDHRLFHEPEHVPISEAGLIGETGLNGPRASGYEFDAAPQAVGTRPDELPGSELLASAAQPNLEWQGLRSDRGADLIDWERPRGGRVVSLGSIGATGSLATDAGVEALVRNVLAAFGVAKESGPSR